MSIVFLYTEFSRLPSPHDWPAPEKQIELLSAALVPQHALVDATALCEAYRRDIESLIDVELKR